MLRKWPYGVRPAARAWEEYHAMKLETLGLQRRGGLLIRRVVAGLRVDPWRTLSWSGGGTVSRSRREAQGHFGVRPTTTRISPSLPEWFGGCYGVELGADEQHGGPIQEELGTLSGSDDVVSLAVRAEICEDGDGEKLNPEESSKYRNVAARAKCWGVDRPDIQFAIKEACWGMVALSGGLQARRPIAVPKVVITTGVEVEGEHVINAFVVSDWAGCRQSWAITSGGVLIVSGKAVREWVSPPPCVIQVGS